MSLDNIIAVRKNKTLYRDGDKVLKVFDESYSKADVLNEALNQARIEETGLHTPQHLFAPDTDDFCIKVNRNATCHKDKNHNKNNL